MTLSAVIQREDDMFVALCPELDVVSQGETSDEAYANLQEAVELLLDDMSAEELKRRSSTEPINKLSYQFGNQTHSLKRKSQ